MTSIGLSTDRPKEFARLVKMLSVDPEHRWENVLTFEEKLTLYESPYSLEDCIGEGNMKEFEFELALNGYFGRPRQVLAQMKEKTKLQEDK
jgi:hypothetical protein